MGQLPTPPLPPQVEIERKLLAALCLRVLDRETHSAILSRLKHHAFAEPDHQVIYRALATMRPVESTDLPNALMQAVTRLGFPDVEFGWLFRETPTREEIIALLKRL